MVTDRVSLTVSLIPPYFVFPDQKGNVKSLLFTEGNVYMNRKKKKGLGRIFTVNLLLRKKRNRDFPRSFSEIIKRETFYFGPKLRS